MSAAVCSLRPSMAASVPGYREYSDRQDIRCIELSIYCFSYRGKHKTVVNDDIQHHRQHTLPGSAAVCFSISEEAVWAWGCRAGRNNQGRETERGRDGRDDEEQKNTPLQMNCCSALPTAKRIQKNHVTKFRKHLVVPSMSTDGNGFPTRTSRVVSTIPEMQRRRTEHEY